MSNRPLRYRIPLDREERATSLSLWVGSSDVSSSVMRNSTPDARNVGFKVTIVAGAGMSNLLKSILHNLGVLLVGMGVALVGTRLDLFFGIARFHSPWAIEVGAFLLTMGFLLRLWATFHFYQHQ